MAADVAVRLGDVANADDDNNRRHIVVINGIKLSAKSAGMDECHFRSHFEGNRQVRCASGKKCGNPLPVEESSHRCGGCGLLFHSQLTCGSKKLSELAGADEFTPAMLPPYGQAKYAQYEGVGDLSFLDICFSCQEKIASETDLDIPAGEDSVQEGAQSAASIRVFSKAVNEILAAALPCIVWEDIVVGAGSNNKVDNKIQRPTFTQLEGIRVDGKVHPTQKISGDILQKLAIKFNIPKARKNAKKANADGLVLFRARQERHKRDGTSEPVTAANVPIKPNTFHFSNVITGSVILPVFQELKGKSLDKSQLQEKLAQDQLIWEMFADEYNNRLNVTYGRHAHESVPRKLDPSEFESIACEHWKVYAQFFKELSANLENALQGWKLSGNHGDLEDVTPPDNPDSVTDVGVLYYYNSLREVDGLIHLCLSMLPQGVQCEMGKNRLPPARGNNKKGNQLVVRSAVGGEGLQLMR